MSKTKPIYECIGLLSSMVNSGEVHTSKSMEVIADARTAIEHLESSLSASEKRAEELKKQIELLCEIINSAKDIPLDWRDKVKL